MTVTNKNWNCIKNTALCQVGSKNGKPKLSAEYEKKLSNNLKELSMVKGNLFAARNHVRTVYVTSCYNAEGKTTTAIALAYGVAANGSSRVLLVDANSRSPQLHRIFGTEIGPGLSDIPDSGLITANLLKATAHNKLSLMTYGSAPSGRPDSAAPRNINHLSNLRNHFDFIVVDGNSVIGSSESVLISEIFDGVLITIESARTRYEVAETVVNKIKKVGGTVLGAVMNKRQYYIPEWIYGNR